MGVDTVGPASGIDHAEYDRFAHWPRRRALTLLILVVALLIEAAIVPITVGRAQIATPPPFGALLGEAKATPRPRDDDLALYDAAIARIRHGENYYRFIVAEHRRAHYPIRPAVAVRLPTLAYLDAWAGLSGQIVASIALLLAVVWAWWRRLAQEPGGHRFHLMAIALMCSGAALGLNRSYFVLHELWAGMLIALSFGLHRPADPAEEDDAKPDDDRPGHGQWLAAWCVAALALAIREHTLPFVLLMAAYAAHARHGSRHKPGPTLPSCSSSRSRSTSTSSLTSRSPATPPGPPGWRCAASAVGCRTSPCRATCASSPIGRPGRWCS